ncbi:dehydration-responsive element-binding protein 1A-like [Papaver somniferum]|uniref:dehydration-responsive element-binding protein 1A-like n=1 Tax=Papaver somniferum TaxID=3469 RepID=UPI000E6FA402|nr:dehydration-responsive element-binding protein 1A-like [Papaver somniferum]
MNFEQYDSSEYSLNSPSSSSGTDQRLHSYSSFESNQTSSGTDQRLGSYSSFESNQGSSFLSPLSQLVSHKKRAGRKKFKETRHPIYRGVRERKNEKWVCEVREPGNSKTRIWLGTHNSPEMAARAYDVAAIALRGESTPLNFEDSLWRLPRAKSSSAKDIQSAIAESDQALLSTESQPRVENNVEEIQESSSRGTFLDEEALFNMPSLMASMAEGMLLDPPQEGYFFDDVECSVDCSSLWSD